MVLPLFIYQVAYWQGEAIMLSLVRGLCIRPFTSVTPAMFHFSVRKCSLAMSLCGLPQHSSFSSSASSGEEADSGLVAVFLRGKTQLSGCRLPRTENIILCSPPSIDFGGKIQDFSCILGKNNKKLICT